MVLDTSAFFAGWGANAGEALIPPSVERELRRLGEGRRLDYLLSAGLQVSAPSARSLETVTARARESGDLPRLSPADIEVLALALDAGCGIVTDDYTIQNLAAVVGMEFQPASMEGIAEVWEWSARCSGCGAEHPVERFVTRNQPCPVCGAAVRIARKVRP